LSATAGGCFNPSRDLCPNPAREGRGA
jgi:hypothetical protein